MTTRKTSRRIDSMGRIVLPVEVRREFGLNTGDSLLISISGDSIILDRPDPACALCGSHDSLMVLDTGTLCYACIDKIRDAK